MKKALTKERQRSLKNDRPIKTTDIKTHRCQILLDLTVNNNRIQHYTQNNHNTLNRHQSYLVKQYPGTVAA